MGPSYLPIAVRAYTARVGPKDLSGAETKRPRHTTAKHRFILVFDTETSTDASQRLLFGSCQYWRITWVGAIPDGICVDEGLFYADDLRHRDRHGFTVLREYAKRYKLKLISQQAFNNEVFYKASYKTRAVVVAFNLPFDLSRIAYGCGDARGRFGGGFSLVLFGKRDPKGVWRENRFRPRLAIKTIDSKRHLIGFTRPSRLDFEDQIPEGASGGKPDPAYTFRGHFLDLRTLAFALTDESHSLESACKAFGVEHPKEKTEEHGLITQSYIAYNRRDVTAAAELYIKLIQEYTKHPIDLQPTKAYSPASIAKAYLKAMGIRPVLGRQPGFPKDVFGFAMTAYFGGRAECRIRRVPVPVVYMDFQSMYPTVCTLMNLWGLMTCQRIEVAEGSPEDLQIVVSNPILLADCFTPDMWKQFVGLAQVEPDNDILPVRSRYDATGQTWQIGVNPLTHKAAVWYSIPDIIASALLTGRAPRILRVFRLIPRGVSPSLRPISLRGVVPVDPCMQDFFKTVIEERIRRKNDRSTSSDMRAQLSAFLKVIGNAGSYGIFAQMDRKELPSDTRERVRVYGLDSSFEVNVSAPEEPGEFAFPPMAACITGGARLMLALLERCVTDASGVYAFCDTDSMAVVATETGGLVPCPGGPHRLSVGREAIRALSWEQVEDIRERFAHLNPYDQRAVPGSLLKLEDENLDPKTNRRRQLWCYVISAKRYDLFNVDSDGRPTLRKWSEHGLGHLLNPSNPDDSDRDWIRRIWDGIVIEDALGQPHHWPDWLVRPAVGRITVSSPSLLRLFAHLNHGNPYADQIKPFNFLLTAFVDALGHPQGMEPEHFQLLAPWTPDPSRWQKLDWIDRYSGEKFRIRARGDAGGDGVARVKTYADVIRGYRIHAEPKSLGSDGRSCSRQTRGLLYRRPVIATNVRYIGKESNKLDDREAGIVHDLGEVVTEYQDPGRDPFHLLVLPVLRNHPTTEVAKAVGLDPTTTRRILGGRSHPRPEHKSALVAMVVRTARDSLRDWGIIAPTDDMACCAAYLEERRRRGVQICPVCHGPLTRRGSRYCSTACKQRAYRKRNQLQEAAN